MPRRKSNRSQSKARSNKSNEAKVEQKGDRRSVRSAVTRGLEAALMTPVGGFTLSCYLAPLLLEFIQPIHEHGISTNMMLSYLFSWPVLVFSSIGLATIFATFRDGSTTKLEPADRLAASWYFCCGFFFNSMMDVCAGQLQAWPMMSERYKQLEPRYLMTNEYAGMPVLVTSLQEIFIQAPLGLLLFFGYYRNRSWTKPLEIVFNMWCVAGVLYYYGSEPLLNFPIVHAPASDWNNAFTFETLYLFWFGFVIMPCLFAAVGVILTVKAVRHISAALEKK